VNAPTCGVASRGVRWIALAALVLIALAPVPAPAEPCAPNCQFLTALDVTNALRAAATAISPTSLVVAVVDRSGEVLGIYLGPTAAAGDVVQGNFSIPVNVQDYAIGLARTGAFFSNNEAPLSSRTVRFISGIHFPPGITNKPPAALYGIENTNRGCSFNVATPGLPRATAFPAGVCQNGNTAGCGTGIVTGKRDVFDSDPRTVDGGGVPIFKGGQVVGGIGVTGVGIDRNATEFAAFMGSIPGPGFGPVVGDPGAVILDGIRLPFVNNIRRPPGVGPGIFNAGGVQFANASTNAGNGTPHGYIVGPLTSPVLNASGNPVLTAAQVNQIILAGVAQANRTRAAIRLPLGRTTRMVLSVADTAGNVLALFRMPDATVFSVDVAVAKARNAVYFSSPTRDPLDLPGVPLGTSVTARTIGFGAQPLYPAGIDGTRSGPFFGSFTLDVASPCTQGRDPNNTVNQSGIVFFPGSIGLYSGRLTLIGGLGVSGDGVEQDDFVTAAAVTPNFVPALEIRADRIIIGDVRLPYFKFPRNPEVQ
jgi:uncharacterized protein GlcG (DUF336 family)